MTAKIDITEASLDTLVRMMEGAPITYYPGSTLGGSGWDVGIDGIKDAKVRQSIVDYGGVFKTKHGTVEIVGPIHTMGMAGYDNVTPLNPDTVEGYLPLRDIFMLLALEVL